MLDDSRQRREQIDKRRRYVLETLGAVGLAGLAGCNGDSTPTQTSGDGGDGGQGSDGSSSFPQVDRTLVAPISEAAPQDGQWNPYFVGVSVDRLLQRLVNGYLGYYNLETNEWVPICVTDYEITPERTTFTIGDDWTWWGRDSEEVTAQDFVTSFKLERYVFGQPAVPMFSDAKVVDEKTVEYTPAASIQRQIQAGTLLGAGSGPSVPHSRFSEYLEKFKAAEEDNDDMLMEDTKEELTKLRIGNENAFGTGPWKLVDWASSEMTCEPHETHPTSKYINFPEFRFLYESKAEAVARGIANGEINLGHDFVAQDAIINTFPDSVQMESNPMFFGESIMCNQRVKPFDDYRVRQAIAHILKFSRYTGLAKKYKDVSPTYWTNINQQVIDRWIPDNLKQKSNDYGGKNYDKAEQLLKDAGLTLEDGTWYKPDGDSFEIEITGAVGRFKDQMLLHVEFLEDFGIPAEANMLKASAAYNSQINGDYQLGCWDWGGVEEAGPWESFAFIFNGTFWRGILGLSQERTGNEDVIFTNVPEFPNPNGKRGDVNISQILKDSRVETDDAKFKEYMQRLAWAFNHNLPIIPVIERFQLNTIDTEMWTVSKPGINDDMYEIKDGFGDDFFNWQESFIGGLYTGTFKANPN